MTQQLLAISANAIISEGENVPDIQSLITRANELNGGVEWWNAAMIWALVFAAIAAIAVVVTTRVALVRARQLGDVQGKLISAKDAQLTFDLKAKDEKISGLDLALTKAKQDLATLQRIALDAKAAQQNVETDLAKQREITANAERKLLELQERVKDRSISSSQYATILTFLKAVRPKELIVVASLLFDGEGREYAREINKALGDAGWAKASDPLESTAGNLTRPTGLIVLVHDENAVTDDAAILFKALDAAGLHPSWGKDPSVEAGRIELFVGSKPLQLIGTPPTG